MVDHMEKRVTVLDCVSNEVRQSYSASFKLLIDHFKKMNNSNAVRKFRVLEASD